MLFRSSSFLPNELSAAFLWAQLEKGEEITAKRRAIWTKYYERLSTRGKKPWFTLPVIPTECVHNAHLFYLLARDEKCRDSFLQHARRQGVSALFHYVPLHLSAYGRARCRSTESMMVTERVASCLIRLPLFADLQTVEVEQILQAIDSFTP